MSVEGWCGIIEARAYNTRVGLPVDNVSDIGAFKALWEPIGPVSRAVAICET